MHELTKNKKWYLHWDGVKSSSDGNYTSKSDAGLGRSRKSDLLCDKYAVKDGIGGHLLYR